MRFGSLFSGIGGFDLGLERVGMDCAWQVEIDGRCRDVLRRHFNAEVYTDVRTVGRNNLEPVDLICGGFPCQDLSVAGRWAGLAGERSGLWSEFARIIDELEPRWVIVENVPGLLSSNRGWDFAVIVRWLAERGYGVAWRVLDAQYFGLAQRRKRVFIVASLGSGRCAEVLFEREGGGWDTAPSREARERVAATITNRFGGNSNQRPPINEADNLIAYSLSSHHGRNDGESTYIPEISYPLANSRTNDHQDESRQTYIVEQNNMASTPDMISLRANPAQPVIAFSAGQSDKAYGIAAAENVAPPIRGGESGTNRVPTIAWDLRQITSKENRSLPKSDSCPTINQAGDMFVGVRRLTPTECSRLQGFPDDWNAYGVDASGNLILQSDSARYRQLGNAVAVPCAEWIGRRIIECDSPPPLVDRSRSAQPERKRTERNTKGERKCQRQ
jgi:DNA (cytosine-5)-methyltransferase 1